MSLEEEKIGVSSVGDARTLAALAGHDGWGASQSSPGPKDRQGICSDAQTLAEHASGGASLLHLLFEQAVDENPDGTALVCGARQWTYDSLDRLTNQLAHDLRHRGVKAGDLVGLCMERSERPIIAILACLKAGAAYVPLDPILPDERIRFILAQCEVTLLLTDQKLSQRMAGVYSGPILDLDDPQRDSALLPHTRLLADEIGLSPRDLCYLIFTSGTTGQPKGVMTEHRNAHAFVLAFNAACSTQATDRIFQGFSLGFDGSVEEIWMAFSNGATLVVGDQATPKFGADLAAYLRKSEITYLSTVPTLLATMDEDIPTLRQLVVSGEVCPPELVNAWAKPSCKMLNVYGPTEATVNTTVAYCEPGKPVTIGTPLQGYGLHVLDEAMRPVPRGEKGQLFISGPGVARGYFKREDLTAQSFVTDQNGLRLYRTGDLVRWNDQQELEFFGRMDGQIKIRGYRVELGEIEAVLKSMAGVAQAAVKAITQSEGVSLAAYVVPQDLDAGIERAQVLQGLQAKLPSYMIPSTLDVLKTLPKLVSGKLDRSRLPDPVMTLVRESGPVIQPATPLEILVAEVWQHCFHVPSLSVCQDFFADLGGHSLVAAQVATQLRLRTKLDVAVRDIYRFPTVRKLAAELETRQGAETGTGTLSAVSSITTPVAPWTRCLVAAGQFVSIYFLYGLLSWPVLFVFQKVFAAGLESLSFSWLMGYSAVMLIGFWPCLILLSIAAKWTLIGRYRPGTFPLGGSYYFRWWIVNRLQAMSGAGNLAGTPLLNLYYRAMGARIGKGVFLETAHCSAWDLISIGDESSLGPDTQILGYRMEAGQLRFDAVTIGRRCFVGAHSALGLGSKLEDAAILDDQSMLPDGACLPSKTSWRGSPAKPASVSVPSLPGRSPTTVQAVAASLLQWIFLLGLNVFWALPTLALSYGLFWVWSPDSRFTLALALISAATLATPFYCLWVACLKRIILRTGRPGIYPLYSAAYYRQWLSDRLMQSSRTVLLPVFTTLYLPYWLRLLGAKIGKRAEMSALWRFSPELMKVGAESFFADGCILGGMRVHLGAFEVRETVVGTRTFVGNSAILPTGSSLGDRCLLGVLSAPPDWSENHTLRNDSDWLGSPSFRLPNRQKVGSFREELTFNPTRRLLLERALIDGLRILIPSWVVLSVAVLGTWAMSHVFLRGSLGIAALVTPVMTISLAAVVVLGVVALKWCVMGRFRPIIVPLWSRYVWLNEMLNGIYESLMAPVLSMLTGTPLIAPALRLLGCRIGKGTYIGSTLFSEFDLVRIGNGAILNTGAIVQTHLFEDRVMKSSEAVVGDRATVGNLAVVLYDGVMEEDTWLGPLSLLMKGEVLPKGEARHGIPTARRSISPRTMN